MLHYLPDQKYSYICSQSLIFSTISVALIFTPLHINPLPYCLYICLKQVKFWANILATACILTHTPKNWYLIMHTSQDQYEIQVLVLTACSHCCKWHHSTESWHVVQLLGNFSCYWIKSILLGVAIVLPTNCVYAVITTSLVLLLS